MRERRFTLLVCVIVALGSITSIVGFCVNFFLGLPPVWLWGFAMVGWSFAVAALGDLLKASQIIKSTSPEVKQ